MIFHDEYNGELCTSMFPLAILQCVSLLYTEKTNSASFYQCIHDYNSIDFKLFVIGMSYNNNYHIPCFTSLVCQ